jgi:hypothetical protein
MCCYPSLMRQHNRTSQSWHADMNQTLLRLHTCFIGHVSLPTWIAKFWKCLPCWSGMTWSCYDSPITETGMNVSWTRDPGTSTPPITHVHGDNWSCSQSWHGDHNQNMHPRDRLSSCDKRTHTLQVDGSIRSKPSMQILDHAKSQEESTAALVRTKRDP